ncbi:MAG: hypothetical protein GY772_23370 [bacterium]|nr:hypothetical protein [bacterium]
MKNTSVLFVSLVMLTTSATAAPGQRVSDDDRLVLIQTMIAEAGWRKARDHAAILHVLDRRRRLPLLAPENLSLADMAKRYSKFHSPHKPINKHRARVKAVTLESAPAWSHEAVTRFYDGTLPDPCRGKALHWGSFSDYRGRTGFRSVVDCGPTHNIFTQ